MEEVGDFTRLLEIYLEYEGLREELPPKLRNAENAEEILELLDNNASESLLNELILGMDRIQAKIQTEPFDILPIIALDGASDSTGEQYDGLVEALRGLWRPAFLIPATPSASLGEGFVVPTVILLVEHEALLKEHLGWLVPTLSNAEGLECIIVVPLMTERALDDDLIRELEQLASVQVTEPYSTFSTGNAGPIINALSALERRFRHGLAPLNDEAQGKRDLLKVGPDALAMSRMICDPDMQPPMAIAIFGNWGSGKSFFMNQINDAIGEVSQRRIHVRTIFFNAWHYVETDLWASLACHIFGSLKELEERAPDSRREEREAILGQMQLPRVALDSLRNERRRVMEDLERQEAEKKREQQAFRDQAHLLDIMTALSLAKDLDHEANRGGDSDEAKNARKVREEAHTELKVVEDLIETTGNLSEDYERIKEEIGKAGGKKVWRQFRKQSVLYSIPIGASLVITGLVWWGVPAFAPDWPSSLLSTATALIGIGSSAIKVTLDAVRRLKAVRNELETKLKKEKQRRLNPINEKINAGQEKIDEIDAKIDEQKKEIEGLENSYRQTFPATELRSFIESKAKGDDYSSGLGLLSMLRQDFERLSKLMTEVEKEKRENGDSKTLPFEDRPPERIVLFIDDLDRCPPKRVVEVLQAVHLLLAFRLFVVVIGVDSRWITECLNANHQELLKDTEDRDARSTNYLEKIFQIPYWLMPFAERSTDAFVRRLANRRISRVHLATGGERSTGEGGEASEAEDSSGGRPLHAGDESLPWTPWEASFVPLVSPLAGTTPRAAKRFFNLYNILRDTPRLWPSIQSNLDEIESLAQDESLPERPRIRTYEAYALALAIANGPLPIAMALNHWRMHDDSEPLEQAIDHVRSADVSKAMQKLPPLRETYLTELTSRDRSAVIRQTLRLSFHGHLLVAESDFAPAEADSDTAEPKMPSEREAAE